MSSTRRELRLALVCSGGVSLAVYMYGITREIQELLIASALSERGQQDRCAPGTTRHAYMQALARNTGEHKVPLKVVVDTISGTSAGGIDGVYLAKAVAGDLSQASLRDLWFTEGDIRKLLAGSGPAWLRVAMFGVRLLLTGGGTSAPLDGNRMINVLHQGLRQMDDDGPREDGTGTLIAPEQSLDLFVTVTDGRGYRRFMTAVPGDTALRDRTHRHVLRFRATAPNSRAFRYGGEINQFTTEYNGALTFAARATSSFPGAFPAIALNDFAKVIARQNTAPFDLDRFAREFFAEYTEWQDDPRQTWFVDGGVLDNHPFGHAINAIEKKSAGAEVDRRIIYVQPEPDPAPPAGDPARDAVEREALRTAGTRPNWIDTILAAKTRIPTHEPILDEITALRSRNERIRRLAALATEHLPEIKDTLNNHPQWRGGTADYNSIRQVTLDMHAEADRRLGNGLDVYQKLRLQSIARSFSDVSAEAFGYPDSSSASAFVRESLTLWIGNLEEVQMRPPAGINNFLRQYDLPFRERRLRFVVAGLNQLYSPVMALPRAEVDAAKEMLYRLLENFWSVPARLGVALNDKVNGLFDPQTLRPWMAGNPQDYVDQFAGRLGEFLAEMKAWIEAELQDTGRQIWDMFQSHTRSWPADVRADLLGRFVGFPLWDATTFPIVALSQIPQATQIKVNRFNPDDAEALPWDGPKLLSTSLKRFGGFFQRWRRENDYLWGRLDGAELLLRLIDPDVPARDLAAAFRSVLAEERSLRVLAGSGPKDLRPCLEDSIAKLEKSGRMEHTRPPDRARGPVSEGEKHG